MALYSKVTAYDRLSTVILGEPTVAISLPRRPSPSPAGEPNLGQDMCDH
jgi:hypothetical protein